MTKKAFTLIELLLVLVIISMLSMYAYKQIQYNHFLSSVVKLQKTVKFIINEGIIKGYANAQGGDCSSNYDFKDLTTSRFISCNDFKQFTLDNTDINFFTGVGLMENYGSCRINVNDYNSTRRSFYIYVDCSKINELYGERYSANVEDSLKFTFENELKSINTSTTPFVNYLNPTITPSTKDGIIRADFKL